MRAERMGERALILRDLAMAPYVAADFLSGLDGVEEAVASYETVGVYYRDRIGDLESLVEAISSRLEERGTEDRIGTTHTIPVCYELGEDFEETASLLGLPADELGKQHGSIEYACYAVGFCPGFAYLGYLPEAIAGAGRLASPRPRIEPGSVGITGRQTAVYPLATPGGWRLIGLTPLTLVDVADDYFPIQAGDRVRFARIDEAEFERLRGERL